MKLRWKKNPKETGLSSVGAGPRGSKLHDGNLTYAVVSALGRYSLVKGWYFVAGWDSKIPYKNTWNEPFSTEDEAKQAAKKYVVEYIKVKEDN